MDTATDLKERILGAVSIMSKSEMERLWDMIVSDFTRHSWDDVPEEEPDEWDLEMLDAIEKDPDCHEFISQDELLNNLGMESMKRTSEK